MLHSTVKYSVIQFCRIQYSTVQCYTVQFYTVLQSHSGCSINWCVPLSLQVKLSDGDIIRIVFQKDRPACSKWVGKYTVDREFFIFEYFHLKRLC